MKILEVIKSFFKKPVETIEESSWKEKVGGGNRQVNKKTKKEYRNLRK